MLPWCALPLSSMCCSSVAVDAFPNLAWPESECRQPRLAYCWHLAAYFGYSHLDYESANDSIHYYYAFVSSGCSSGWPAVVGPLAPWPVELDFVAEAERRSGLAMN